MSRAQEGTENDYTPIKILNRIAPIPTLREKQRKRVKLPAKHITSPEFIATKREQKKRGASETKQNR